MVNDDLTATFLGHGLRVNICGAYFQQQWSANNKDWSCEVIVFLNGLLHVHPVFSVSLSCLCLEASPRSLGRCLRITAVADSQPWRPAFEYEHEDELQCIG